MSPPQHTHTPLCCNYSKLFSKYNYRPPVTLKQAWNKACTTAPTFVIRLRCPHPLPSSCPQPFHWMVSPSSLLHFPQSLLKSPPCHLLCPPKLTAGRLSTQRPLSPTATSINKSNRGQYAPVWEPCTVSPPFFFFSSVSVAQHPSVIVCQSVYYRSSLHEGSVLASHYINVVFLWLQRWRQWFLKTV